VTETKRTFSISKKDERGVASVIALLVAALLYLMGVMFLSVSSTEVTMAASRTNGLTAFYLSDAAIEHARRSLQGKDLSQVLDGTTPVFAGGNTVNLAGGSYTVQVTNNILANGFPLSTIPADPSASATVDSDGIIVVTSTGTFRNATQVIEAIIRSNMPDAIVTGDNLQISGDAIVNGSAGSIHSNGDMDVSGNPTISQDLTASDLVPFWVYPLDDGAKIERHVPALPLSREVERLLALRRSLVVYRMVFGQTRQEDLVRYLLERLPESEIQRVTNELRVDLSPPRV